MRREVMIFFIRFGLCGVGSCSAQYGYVKCSAVARGKVGCCIVARGPVV